MSTPTQKWFFLLSVCLLLQQFAPVYTAHVKKHKQKHTPLQDENNNSSKDIQEAGGEKRFIAGASFIGSKLLSGITFGAYGVAFGSTVLQAIAGCKITQPTIEDDFNKFQELQDEYDEIKKQIRDVSKQATDRQIYSNDTFYNYRDTRDLVRALADEQTLVLRSMGPEVLLVINNVTYTMERVFEEANKTQQEVDVLKVDTEFAEGLELGLRLTMTSAALAIPGMQKLWKKYLKHSTVGKKITGFIEKFSSKIKEPIAAAGKKTLSKILSKGILGKAKTKITAKLNKIISKVAPKFDKAKRLFGVAKSAIKGLVKLGGAALAVWTAVETFNNCKAKAAEAKKSVEDMTGYVEEIKGHLAEVKEANEDVQQAWMDVYNTSIAEDLLEALTDMKTMIQEDYFSKDQEEKQNVAEKIQAYLDVKDLDPTEEGTKSILNQRQRDMNEILGTITVTLSCFRHKGNAFGAVKMECARGDSPFPFIYDDIVNKVPVDPAKKCLHRTGEEYITEDKMKEAWTSWVQANATGIDAICSMNNKIIVERVKDFLRQKITDANEIASKIFTQEKLTRGGVADVEAMITKIKEENPNIENELTDSDKFLVCNLKKNFPDNPESVINTMKLVNPGLAETLTVEIVENLQCD